MREFLVSGLSLPQVYHKALRILEYLGEIRDCEWQDRKSQMKECSMTMEIQEPLFEPMISRLWIGGPKELEQYRQEMLDGILDFRIGNGWDYTYHDRMVNFNGIDQIHFVIDELRRCPYSRRAVISIRTDYDMRSEAEDPACLQHIQYMIRDGKLHCKVLFRSNDACKATFMNAFALIMLQKRIAEELDVPMGSYTHRANSFHCYKEDWDKLKGYVDRIENSCKLTYSYIGEFDEMMEEEKEEIAKQVAELKEKMQ